MITSLSDNKELIRRWIAFANTGFLGSFDGFISHDYVGRLGVTLMDRNELERLERQFVEGFPDAQYSIDDLIAEHDRVALRTTARVTHCGRFQGIEPTGRSVEFTGLVIYRIRDGRIVESWGRSTSCGCYLNCASHEENERCQKPCRGA